MLSPKFVRQNACEMRSIGYALLYSADALEENLDLKEEIESWKEKYNKLLDSLLSHAEHMSGMMLKAALDGAFKRKKND